MDRLTQILDARGNWTGYYLRVDTSDHYVKARFGTAGTLVEAADVLRDPRQEATLEALGWLPPSEPDSRPYRSNYHRVWDLDAPTAEIVTFVSRTLAAVYLSHEGETVELWWGTLLPRFLLARDDNGRIIHPPVRVPVARG